MRKYISILFLICIWASFFSSKTLALNTDNYKIDKQKDVGEIPFEVNTTPTGALTYSVPIECYPNPKGLQPNLSLAYNSMSGMGVAGTGWSISGLSSISRINSTYYYDGEVRAASFSDDCAFALDGVRLVKKKGTDYLVTEQGNILVKPYFEKTNFRFEVFYPNGNKAIYKAIYKEGWILDPLLTISYPIAEMEDKDGNSITYLYETVNDVPYISEINYAPNYISNSASIHFSYKTISAGVPSFFDGKKFSQTYLLEKVRVQGPNSSENVYELNLKYLQKQDIYYLEKISKESVLTKKEVNPLVFTYGSDKEEKLEVSKRTLVDYPATVDSIVALIPVKFSAKEPTNGLIVMPEKSTYNWDYSLDYNINPGFSKYYEKDEAFIYRDINSKESPLKVKLTGTDIQRDGEQQPWPSIFRGLFTLDYEGNGDSKILKISEKTRDVKENYSTHLFQIFNSDGSNESELKIDIPEKFVLYSNKGSVYSTISRTYLIGDFIGSGRDNLMYITHSKDFNKDKRSSTAVFVDFNQKEVLYNKECFDVDPSDILYAIDFDGDGRSEIFHMSEDGVYVYKFDLNSGFKKIVDWNTRYMLPGGGDKPAYMYLFGDINGDGKTDFIRSPVSKNIANDKNSWTYYFSNGKDGFERVKYGESTPPLEELAPFYPDNKYILQDMDGNGLPDLVVLDQQGTVSVYKNIKGKLSPLPVIAPEKVAPRSKLVLSRVREANKLFPVMGIKDGNLSLISNSVNQQEDQLMKSSVSSYGVETRHTYGTLTNKEVCTVEDTESLFFPYNYIIEDVFVLKSIETSLNDQKTSSATYRYHNPVVHRQGLGFGGFEQVTMTDNLRGQTTKQTLDPKRFGALTDVQSPTLSVKNEYDTLFLGNKQVQVLLKKEVRNDILNGTTATSIFEYDKYGNLTNQSIDYGDGIKTATNRILDNIDTGNKYLLGLLKEEKQTDTRDGVSSITKTNVEYNSLYLPESKKSYYNNNLVSEEKYKYDSSNNPEQIQIRNYTSQDWLTTTYEYDGLGRKIKETDPLGLFTEYIYGNKNLLQSIKNHKGHTTTYVYDTWGRNTSISYPDGTAEATSLVWADSPTGALIVSTSTATGQPDVQTYYDAFGREIRKGQKRFDGVYLYSDNQYDKFGRLEKSSLPFRGANLSYWNTYEYDSYDRIKVLNYASGKKDIYTYGKLQTRSDIDGVASIKTYNVTGQVISIEDAAGIITYKYRSDGQPEFIIAPGDIKTSFEYDNYGRQTKINDPSAGTKTFAYDASGNISQETDARGKVTKMTYDSYNRLKRKEVVDELITNYTFNTDGLREGESSNNSTSKIYFYDELLRLKSQKETIPDGKWLEKTYTYANGNLSSASYASQSGVITTQNYIYTNGHNTEIKLHDGTSIWKLTGENSQGMVSLSTTGILSRTYGYDNFGLPTSRVIKNGMAVIQDFGYSIDPETGNLNWRKDNTRGLVERFTYDKLNRLTGFGDKKMSYDEKGNITYLPNVGQFQYSSSKPYALETIAACQEGDLGDLQNYRREQTVTYNNMMRPLSIKENNRITTFTYNGDADRVKMLTQRGDTTELERYYIGGEYEIDKIIVGTEERLYLGGDAYSAAAVYVKQGTGAWQVQYIGRDYLGSITHVMDATGIVKQELSYDPWGRLRNPVTQALYDIDTKLTLVLGDRGYTGHEHLTHYGLINMNARLYDPVVGRFLSPDPYVQVPDMSQNFNRYSYALNNPLKFTDANGESWFFAVAALIGSTVNIVTNWDNITDGGFHLDKFLAYGVVGAAGGLALGSGNFYWGLAIISAQGGANQFIRDDYKFTENVIVKSLGSAASFIATASLMNGLPTGGLGLDKLIGKHIAKTGISNYLAGKMGTFAVNYGVNFSLSIAEGAINGEINLEQSATNSFWSSTLSFGIDLANDQLSLKLDTKTETIPNKVDNAMHEAVQSSSVTNKTAKPADLSSKPNIPKTQNQKPYAPKPTPNKGYKNNPLNKPDIQQRLNMPQRK